MADGETKDDDDGDGDDDFLIVFDSIEASFGKLPRNDSLDMRIITKPKNIHFHRIPVETEKEQEEMFLMIMRCMWRKRGTPTGVYQGRGW